MGREKHTGDIVVNAAQVALTKSTHITGSMEIKGDVLITGELVVDGGPLIITGKVTVARGAVIEVEGSIVHNGAVEDFASGSSAAAEEQEPDE